MTSEHPSPTSAEPALARAEDPAPVTAEIPAAIGVDRTTPTAPTTAAGSSTPAGSANPPEQADPPRAPRGPSPLTVFTGVVGLLVALGTLLVAEASVDVDWGRAGPALVVGMGLLLVVLGLLGMRSDRRA
jgi:hypothetical protein